MIKSNLTQWRFLTKLQQRIVGLNFVFGLSRGVVIPFLFVELKDRYQASLSSISYIVAVSIIFRVVGSLLGGIAADRYNKRSVVVLGSFLNSLFFLALALKTNLWVAASLYLAINFSQSVFRTVFSAMIGESLKKEDAIVAYAFFHTAQNLAIGIGAALGGLLLEQKPALIYLFCFIVLLLFSLGVFRSREFKKIIVPEKVLSKSTSLLEVSRPLWLLLLLNLVLVLPYGIFNEVLGVIFKEAHIEARHIGFLFALNSLLIVTFQMPITAFIKSFSFKSLISSSLVLFTLYLFTLNFLFSSYALFFATLSIVFFSLGEILHVSVMNAEVNKYSDVTNQGRNFGFLSASWSLGFGVGPSMLSCLSVQSGYALASVMSSGVVLVLGAGVIFLLHKSSLEGDSRSA